MTPRWRDCGAALLLVVLGHFGVGAQTNAGTPPTVTVFAASSLAPVLEKLAPAAGRGGLRVRHSFAASSILARQVEAGAAADVVITADGTWMTYLADRSRLAQGSRTGILGNRLVLVVPADQPIVVTVDSRLDLEAILRKGRLAIGDPEYVAAGVYAREALLTLGLWWKVKSMLAPTDSVRATLALVERGEAPAGIVYQTDAVASTKVAVAGVFPESSHRPIVYEAAIVAGRDSAAARQYLAFLRSPDARAVFTGARFTVK